MSRRLRRTKIVTTLCPATDRDNNLEKIIAAGANVVRMNFSHGTAEDHILRANKVREIAAAENAVVVVVCCAIEADIAELDDADRAEFMADLGIEEPGLNRVIRSGYELLNLQTYFTAGVKEVRAWTIPVGATAP